MLRCVRRSFANVGCSSQLQAFVSDSVSTTLGPMANFTAGWKREGKRILSSPGMLLMRPTSSSASSTFKGRAQNKTVQGNFWTELPAAPRGELPPNLKLAPEVEKLLHERNQQRREDDSQEIYGNPEGSDGGLKHLENASTLQLAKEDRGGLKDTDAEVLSWSQGTTLHKCPLDPQVFGVPIRRDVVHEVIRWQLAKRRAGNAKTKRIGEIRGSGRKVRPQKKQGIARAGHSRPPHWRGGAKAHGPRIRDWSYKLNKKFIKLGLRVALSARLREGKLKVVDILASDGFSTSKMLKTLEARGINNSVLFIDQDVPTEAFLKSTANVVGLKAVSARGANVYDIVKRSDLVITESGISRLEQALRP